MTRGNPAESAALFKVGDFVYVITRNSIGEVLAVFEARARGVQDVRTDVDGMQDGADLEHLNAVHFTKPGVFLDPSTAKRFGEMAMKKMSEL